MKKVVIDFSKAKYVMDLHYIIKESFQRSVEGFPDFYGNNLSALWDCLTGFIETPVEIVLTGIDSLSKDLKEEAYEMIKVFERADRQGIWDIYFHIE
ncbi:MAG: barstar family protein [Clostridiales bacterium]|jgi:ribonuclease inhibitor|nr:barstar family protein [Clostridiales bacterium]